MRILRCYLYDSKIRKKFLLFLIKYINEKKISDIIINKSYIKGFHIEIAYSKDEYCKELEQAIKNFLEENKRQYKEEEYKKFAKSIETIKSMEENNCEVIPIYQDGDLVIEENGEFQKGKNVYSFNIKMKIERFKTKCLREVYEIWSALNKEEKNIEAAKMFFITSSINSDGIRIGYLSLRSNYEHFKQQLIDLKEEKKAAKWLETIEFRSEKELSFIKNGVNKFLIGEYNDEFILSRVKKIIGDIENTFRVGLQNNELYLENLYMADDFSERHRNVSDFHKAFYSNKRFLELYKGDEFIIYRYVVSSLYALMTMLDITPLERQKITGIVAEAVELNFNVNWENLYNELNLKYGDKKYEYIFD